MKLNELKLQIGMIKENPSDTWRGMEGLELLSIDMNCDFICVINPIKLEQMEHFYKVSFEDMGRGMITDDYDYFIWYMLNEDCEFTCRVRKDDLENVRKATEEDLKLYRKNVEEFKKIHKVYEIQDRIKHEEEIEERAGEEFKQLPKEKAMVKLKEEDIYVDAVFYKGFAVHDIVGSKDDLYKAITIIGGEHEGFKLSNCNVSKYKNLIDEIREAIGDKIIEDSDQDIISNIIKKY